MYVMFWFERHAPVSSIEAVGVQNVLVETDVPHPTCFYPGALEHFEEVLSGCSPYTRRRVLHDNAAELYRIPVT
jgi:predicted TIM-barrel fold metal-dependent hydrolase